MRLAQDVLVIDVGNSKSLAVLFRGGREIVRFRIARGPHPNRTWKAVCGAIAEVGGAAVPAVVASVAPRAGREAIRSLARAGWVHVHEVAWNDPWPYSVALQEPWTVGVDRLANVAGLRALGFRRAIAIDVGTAVTCDVLGPAGFTGGLILPGLELVAAALHRGTAHLPHVRVAARPPLIGRDTRSSLASGIYHGTFLGLGGIAHGLQARLGPGARVVTTGAQGADLAELGPPSWTHFPDLTLWGLRLLASRLGRAGTRRHKTK